MGNDRYKLFRNFMVNELQITREDIEQWTKESVEKTVKGLVGQMNVSAQIQHVLSEAVRRSYDKATLHQALAQAIADKFAVSIEERKP